jgi:hypothetical protein
MQAFRLIIISLCLALSATNAHAGFFDDLFGSDEEEVAEAYSIELRDIDGANPVISHDEKVLKLKIFYPKTDSAKIDDLTNPQLKAAVQDTLTVTSVDTETGDETDLGDLNFVIRFKEVTTKYQDFYEMQFLSQGIVLDTPQRLDFSFNAKQFARLLNVGTEPDEDRYTDKLYIKPIVIELASPVIDGLITIDDPDINALTLSGYAITATVTDDVDDPISTSLTTDDVAFTYKLNGKTKTATAKFKTKTIAITPSADSVPEFTTLEDANTYSLLLPVTIDSTISLRSQRSYNTRIPLQLETETESGLKVLLRGIAKGVVTAP